MQNASAPSSSASPMDSDRPTATSSTEAATGFVDSDAAREVEMLREIVRMLPASVTVQDDQGDFLLVNDAAAIQFNASADQFNRPDPQSDFLVQALTHRRTTALDLLQSGRSAVFEERVNSERDRRVFLTTHRPVRIGDRSVLLSSATDVSRQKEMEEELFRRAYYDELTDLPTRRVIEKHVGDIIGHSGETSHFALAFLDIDNFKHINDYYGHSVGDALLVQFAKRLALDLRGTDMLSRISGDEFLLLLNPIQSQQEVAEYLELLVQRLRAAVLHRRLRSIRLRIDRCQPLSRTRPQLRRAASERRYRDVSREE